MIKITETSIDVQTVINRVYHPSSGGIDVFIGTVRDVTGGKNVVALEFEAYEKMALSELHKIAYEIKEKWPIHEISVEHAVGRKEIGDIAVVIAVSAAHRAAAFEACRYMIDTLKQTVPIWKKEIFEDGKVWVAAHP